MTAQVGLNVKRKMLILVINSVGYGKTIGIIDDRQIVVFCAPNYLLSVGQSTLLYCPDAVRAEEAEHFIYYLIIGCFPFCTNICIPY
jgi:hypothetical protein